MSNLETKLIIRQLGRQPYIPIWQAMQKLTDERDLNSFDEVWFVEHDPVFTQGLAGKSEHILNSGDIPVVQVDRGGQVTYHGPGQQVIYFLIDLKRKKLGVRQLVTIIEELIIELLSKYNIPAYSKTDAPGVYVDNRKICSLGLKIRKGCSFHGLALNVCMDKEPFKRINPCGYTGLEVTEIAELGGPDELTQIREAAIPIIMKHLNYRLFEMSDETKFINSTVYYK